MLHPQLRQRLGEEHILPILKNSSHRHVQQAPQSSHKEEGPFYLPAQIPPKTSCSLALETSSIFRFARNYQIHHKELWGLPDSQLWPPTPIPESYLAGRGIQFLDSQQSGAPVP